MSALLADAAFLAVVWLCMGGHLALHQPARAVDNERCGDCGGEATSTHRCPGRPRTAPSWALRDDTTWFPGKTKPKPDPPKEPQR